MLEALSPPSLPPSSSSSLFREYDIRGCTETHLTPTIVYKIAQAFGEYLRLAATALPCTPLEVCLAHDGRLTSPMLAEAFAEGLQDQGVSVVFLGLGPTPFLYWAEHHLHTMAGVMITGSHNPPQDNGIKLTFQKKPFFGNHLQELYQSIQLPFRAQSQGKRKSQDLLQAYSEHLATTLCLSSERPLKIIWDPGHGAVSAVLRRVLQTFSHPIHILNEAIHGSFPNRSPDPTKPGALQHLQETIQQEKADLGFAFDGDGDRVVVMDGSGKTWMGDELLVFMAEQLSQTSPSLTVIADIKSSPFLLRRLEERKIPFWIAKTGHVHIKKAIAQRKAMLGGEVSGHFFFTDQHWGFDDGLYTALRLISLLSKGASLLAWRHSLSERFSSPELRLTCPEAIKEKFLNHTKKYLELHQIPFQELDGILVKRETNWWLIRSSQTEPVLVIRWEALTQDAFQEVKEEIQTYLHPWKLSLP